jgi:uncharacterized membrane protein YbhN (UPF0104 family)
MTRKNSFQNLFVYCIAAAIIWYVARDVSINDLIRGFSQANLWLFIPASVLGFLIWFVGETILFARLFTYFHKPTSFREMIQPNAAQYFLELVNLAVASGALIFFLHRRKGVPWLAGGCTLMFQGLLDVAILAAMALAAAGVVPTSQIRVGVPYAAAALLGLCAIAAIFLWWKPERGLGLWIYERPSLISFRLARPIHYLKLTLIRTPIFVLQGFVIYWQLLSFGVRVPLIQVFALTPAVVLIGGLPVTPVGIGPLQAIVVGGFSAYGSKTALLATSLAVSGINVAFRIPLGWGAAGAFAHEVRESPGPHEQEAVTSAEASV